MKTTKSPLTLIFLGLQGSGKGTQALELKKRYPFFDIDMGSVFRKIIKSKKGPSEVFKIVPKGKLVPAKVTNKLIKREISNIPSSRPLIIDGCPRSISQAEGLDKILREAKRDKNYFAIFFKIKKKTGLERLLSRWICSKCGMIFSSHKKKCKCGGNLEKRRDETPELIRNRFKYVSKYLDKLKLYYKKRQRLIEINAERGVKEITKDVIRKAGL